MTLLGHEDGTEAQGYLQIPDVIEYGSHTYTVLHIADNAFKDCYGLVGNLVLPASVRTIGNYAFYGTGFTGELSLPPALRSIGDYAFSTASSAHFSGNLNLPSSVTSIGYAAFGASGFDGILTIGSGMQTIGAHAFGDTGFTR